MGIGLAEAWCTFIFVEFWKFKVLFLLVQ